jgi:hypothetical protein
MRILGIGAFIPSPPGGAEFRLGAVSWIRNRSRPTDEFGSSRVVSGRPIVYSPSLVGKIVPLSPAGRTAAAPLRNLWRNVADRMPGRALQPRRRRPLRSLEDAVGGARLPPRALAD